METIDWVAIMRQAIPMTLKMWWQMATAIPWWLWTLLVGAVLLNRRAR